MTILQKAVLPGREHAWLALGDEMLAGYVVRADDVAWATTSSRLYDAHGLGFPDSPVPDDALFVDVVRFPSSGFQELADAVGGNDRSTAERMGGSFVDHPPFTGNGFVATDEVVPLWWLAPTRVPAGTQIVRVSPSGDSVVLAVYVHVGIGWQVTPGIEVDRVGWLPPSETLGLFAEIDGERVLADVLSDGSVVVCSPVEKTGMERSDRGIWWRLVDASESVRVTALVVDATWQGLRFRVVRRQIEEGVEIASLVYVGHDALAAEAAGLAKTEHGVYEAVVPWSELTEVSGAEIETAP